MGKTTMRIVGVCKDRLSLSKALVLSKPNTCALNLAVVRATTHQAANPPRRKHINFILSYGDTSRSAASTCTEALIHRLRNTHNSVVAFKCLLTFHHIINRGSPILQDQLSVYIYPSVSGRNYLNLSTFNHNSTSGTRNLSSWVRWYAKVFETLLFASQNLGFFLSSSSAQKNDERVSSLSNKDLTRELDVLVNLIEEICKAPELLNLEAEKLAHQVKSLVEADKCSAQKEIMVRIKEIKQRIGSLSFGDSVELICVLKRFENCKERLLLLFLNRANSIGDRLWILIAELKERIAETSVKEYYCEGSRFGKRVGVSESARFGDRVLRPDESMQFGSSRFGLARVPLPVLESIIDIVNGKKAFQR